MSENAMEKKRLDSAAIFLICCSILMVASSVAILYGIGECSLIRKIILCSISAVVVIVSPLPFVTAVEIMKFNKDHGNDDEDDNR